MSAAIHSRVLALSLILAFLVLTGCDQVKDLVKQRLEMDKSEPAEVSKTPVAEVTPAPTPTPSEPVTPPQRTDQQIIQEFFATPPHQITDKRLAELANIQEGRDQIQELDLTRSAVTSAGLLVLSAFPNLVTLKLNGTRINDSGLDIIPTLTKLDLLDIGGTHVGDDGIAKVAQVKSIRSLNLSATPVSENVFVPLAEMEQLEILILDGNPNLRGNQLAKAVQSGAFRNLRILSANRTSLGYYGLQQPGRMPLEEVFLRQANVADATVEALSRYSQLRLLDLASNSLTDAGVQHLSKLRQLERLDLSNNGITNASFNFLKNLKTLKTLDVSGTRCPPQSVEQLADKFLKQTTITFNGRTYRATEK